MQKIRTLSLRTIVGSIAALALVVAVATVTLRAGRPATQFEVIAHRGVHQPVRGDIARHETPIAADACTAWLIEPTGHSFIENTLSGISAAFADGATMVEVDTHLSADGQVVVFHDYYLDCRTDAVLRGCRSTRDRGHQRCLIGDQPLAFLKTLDVGYGYSTDGGKTFPLRGKGVGAMPTLGEVLAAFPGHRLLLDVKGGAGEAEAVARLVGSLPAAERALVSWYDLTPAEQRIVIAAAPGTQVAMSSLDELRRCARWYLTTGWVGYVPEHCRGLHAVVPLRYLSRLGPLARPMVRVVRAEDSTLVVAFVETVGEVRWLDRLEVDGVLTNHVEVVGPALRARGR